MWQETLHQLDHKLTPAKAIALWAGDPNSFKLVNDGFNVVFYFTSHGQGRYLKFTHQNIQQHNKLDMLSALQFQSYLADQGVRIAKPLMSTQGQLVEMIQQDHLVFKVSCVAEVPGTKLEFSRLTTSAQYFLWGQTLAEFHQASAHFAPAAGSHYKNWHSLLNESLPYLKDPMIAKEFHALQDYFAVLHKDAGNFGLTHGDMRPANILFDGAQFYIIDIDEPVYHWYAADIIRPFLELAEAPFSSWQSQFEDFLAGYTSIRTLSEEDRQSFNWLARMKNLDAYLWSSNNWHNPRSPDNNEPTTIWLERWRQRVGKEIFDAHHFT